MQLDTIKIMSPSPSIDNGTLNVKESRRNNAISILSPLMSKATMIFTRDGLEDKKNCSIWSRISWTKRDQLLETL